MKNKILSYSAYFHYGKAYWKALNFRRWQNYQRLKSGFKNRKMHSSAKPFAASIEPTTACNLGCSQCPSGLKQFSRKTGNLNPEAAKNWIDQLLPEISYINFYFQGEPLIHPRLEEIISHASKNNIISAISSNGHFISKDRAKKLIESGLKRIIISVDGLEQNSYEKYREGGKLEKVIEGIKNLKFAKKELKRNNPLIEVQFIAFKHNEHEIPKLKKQVKEWGSDLLSIKTAQVYDAQSAENLLPENPKYLRYTKKSDGSFELINEYKNECWRMWSSVVLTQNGEVVPCCFDKDAKHQLGKLEEDNFENIWNNKRYKSFREKVFSNRKQIDICRNCSEGSKIYE